MKKPTPSVDLGYPTEAHGKIPAFHSVEEEAAFWDTHDTTEFSEGWTAVNLKVGGELAQKLTLRLERADREALARYAQRKGVGSLTLARMWIKEHLREEDTAGSG